MLACFPQNDYCLLVLVDVFMKKSLFALLAFFLLLARALPAPAQTGKGADILDAAYFRENQLEAPPPGSPLMFKLRVNSTLAPYTIKLTVDTAQSLQRFLAAKEHQPEHIGDIEVYKEGETAATQKIGVTAKAPSDFFIQLFKVQDINFDGYLDLCTAAEFGGASWNRYQYFIFEPASGRFIENWLTESLAELEANQIDPDPAEKLIRVSYLVYEGISEKAFRIGDRELVLAEQKELKPDPQRYDYLLVTKRPADGTMETVKTERRKMP